MIRILTFILSLSILLQSFSTVAIIAGYQLNKESITRNFCVNKNKPKMHCNGKCHLKMLLKEHQNKEQSPNTSIEIQKNLQFYQESYSFNSLQAFSSTIYSFLNPVMQELYSRSLRPPNC